MGRAVAGLWMRRRCLLLSLPLSLPRRLFLCSWFPFARGLLVASVSVKHLENGCATCGLQDSACPAVISLPSVPVCAAHPQAEAVSL